MTKKKIVRRDLITNQFIYIEGGLDELINHLESIKKLAKDKAKKKGYVLVNDKFYVNKTNSWYDDDPYFVISADTEETDKEMEARFKRSESAKESAAKRIEATAKRELKELERLKKKYEKHQKISNEN
jgi:hypothetical protein